MDSELTAEETLAMVEIIAASAVILVKTEIDGDIFTRTSYGPSIYDRADLVNKG